MADFPDFTVIECLRTLQKLGFVIDLSKGKGGHAKAYPPKSARIVIGQRPFIIVPTHGRFRLQRVILKELGRMGIPKSEFLKALKR